MISVNDALSIFSSFEPFDMLVLSSVVFGIFIPITIGYNILRNIYKDKVRSEFRRSLAAKLSSDSSRMEEELAYLIVNSLERGLNSVNDTNIATISYAQDHIADMYFKRRLYEMLIREITDRNVIISEKNYAETVNLIESWKYKHEALKNNTIEYIDDIISRDKKFARVKKYIEQKDGYFAEKQIHFVLDVKEALHHAAQAFIASRHDNDPAGRRALP